MIIVKGGARADGGQLARYLLTKGGNGSIDLLQMRSLAGISLRADLRIAEVEAEQTRGTKPFWHAQIAPAEGVVLTREQQIMAADVLEKHLGFEGLPRAIVEHVKDGRPHTHVVWSRFDRETGRLRRDDFTKHKNVSAAAEIATRLGLEPNQSPFAAQDDAQTLSRQERREQSRSADSHAEQQQATRTKISRRERKAEISAIWAGTDNGHSLRTALDEAGYTLARGYRGFVVIDAFREAHSLARQVDGIKAKDVRARLADIDPGTILSAKEIKAAMRQARQDRERELAQTDAHQVMPSGAKTNARSTTPQETTLSDGLEVAGNPPEPAHRASHGVETRPIPAKTAGSAHAPVSDAGDGAQAPKSAADILATLTRHHSTFTRQDLARLVDKETGGGGHEPWMMKSGGLEGLDDDARASAERSYANWAEKNPALAERFGLGKYVAYTQDRQARQDAADPEALKVRKESKAAFDKLMAEVEGSTDLIRLGPDHNGRGRFSTREMLQTELRMEGAAGTLADRAAHGVDVRIRDAVPGLDLLGAEQRAAFEHVTAENGLSLVVGFAGTGKSRMLGLAREAWEAAGYRVRGAALSGVAAESLQNDAGIQSRTLHSLLHHLGTVEERAEALAAVDQQLDALRGADGSLKGHKRGNHREREYLAAKRAGLAADIDAATLTERDVIVIDEAAMVGSRQMEDLLTRAERAGAKVVLVGDHEQLQAVDAGAAFRALRDRHGAHEITEVRRQAGEDRQWMREATQEFGRTETADALGRYRDAGMTHQAATRETAKVDLVDGWTAARQAKPGQSQIILAYTRVDVAELNGLARAAYRQEGRLGEDTTLATAEGEKAFAEGDRLYFTKNDMRLSVKNGTLGSIEKIDGDRVTVALDAGRSVEFDVKDYDHITHGYAATVHKSQGVTVDQAHVLASRYMDRHAAYVGMTRHRDRADLYYGTDEFKTFDAMARRMSRSGSKDTTLDYLARAAEGQASDSFRDAVADFYRRERPDMQAPDWTERPASMPTEHKQSDHQPSMSRADRMMAEYERQEADGKKSGDRKPDRDRFGDMRDRMSDAEKAAADEEIRQRKAAEDLRQQLGQRQRLGGLRL